MTRRVWFARLAALLPFCATRFSGPVALGSLKVGERFRFGDLAIVAEGGRILWERGSMTRSGIVVHALGARNWWALKASTLVYRVR